MSFAEYQSVSYGYQLRESKHEQLFRSIWVQLNNVNAQKKADLIRNPEKYWRIPLIDIKQIEVPTPEQMDRAYEIAKQWQTLNFTEAANYDTLKNTIK